MTKKILRDYVLTINHYEGDQTVEELHDPCGRCVFNYIDKNDDFTKLMCSLYNLPTRECLRMCISQYRLDTETLIDAMKRKMWADNKAWNDWIASFPKYMKPEDGKLYVLEKPDDIIQVMNDLDDDV